MQLNTYFQRFWWLLFNCNIEVLCYNQVNIKFNTYFQSFWWLLFNCNIEVLCCNWVKTTLNIYFQRFLTLLCSPPKPSWPNLGQTWGQLVPTWPNLRPNLGPVRIFYQVACCKLSTCNTQLDKICAKSILTHIFNVF